VRRRSIDLLRIDTRSGPLQVVTLPWFTRSLFLSREEYRITAEVDLDRAIGRAVSDSIELLTQALDPATPAVLLAHISVQGASLGFEQSIMLGRDATVGLDELHSPSFDYIALGHIHRHQFVGVHPPAIVRRESRPSTLAKREPKGYARHDRRCGRRPRRLRNLSNCPLGSFARCG
jgi:exonuclease SbcD